MHNDQSVCRDVKSKDVLKADTKYCQHDREGILIKMSEKRRGTCHKELVVINNNLHTQVPRCAHCRCFDQLLRLTRQHPMFL